MKFEYFQNTENFINQEENVCLLITEWKLWEVRKSFIKIRKRHKRSFEFGAVAENLYGKPWGHIERW